MISFLANNDYETEQRITGIEVIRVKEGSTMQYLSNTALKSTSGVKTDSCGRKYVEKTCINGNVYRDYKERAIVQPNHWGGGVSDIFVAD